MHCDPEVRLQEPRDWITPSIELMQRDRRVMAANPSWYAPTPEHDTLARTTLEYSGPFSLGLGFSDQLFLARRSELAAPIYGQRCLASRRYPMANVSLSFEGRVDAWMRHHDRLRANFLEATYVHPDTIGGAYPSRRAGEKLASLCNRAADRDRPALAGQASLLPRPVTGPPPQPRRSAANGTRPRCGQEGGVLERRRLRGPAPEHVDIVGKACLRGEQLEAGVVEQAQQGGGRERVVVKQARGLVAAAGRRPLLTRGRLAVS